jgi:imidazolonepropionase-like amidohydrolase
VISAFSNPIALPRMRTGLIALAAILAAPAAAQTIAVTNGKVAIGDGSAPVENGTVVIRNGRVVAAGANVAIPADAQRIDAQGRWVTPGLVAGFTQLGLVEVEAVGDTNDVDAGGSPFSAALDIAPAVNARVAAMAISRGRGVTRAVVAPDTARTMFAGQGALVDTGEDREAVFAPRAFQFVEFGERGAREAGGSRAAAFAFFRNAMLEVRDYARNPAAYGGRDTDALLMRADAAALVPVVEGRMPLLVHVERASDILEVLRLRQEFPSLKLVLVGASEGWMVADRIKAAGVPVIASALNDLPSSFELLAATQSNYGRMLDAGVKLGVGEIGGQPRNAKQSAGNLVALSKVPGASGLSWDEALAAVTSGPAEVMGMGNEFGSLRPGRRGDVVIWDGDPLELSSAPVAMLIDGVQQPLENRQTRLRDRYLNPTEAQLPKAYDR